MRNKEKKMNDSSELSSTILLDFEHSKLKTFDEICKSHSTAFTMQFVAGPTTMPTNFF
jgi:hypothetical protein